MAARGEILVDIWEAYNNAKAYPEASPPHRVVCIWGPVGVETGQFVRSIGDNLQNSGIRVITDIVSPLPTDRPSVITITDVLSKHRLADLAKIITQERNRGHVWVLDMGTRKPHWMGFDNSKIRQLSKNVQLESYTPEEMIALTGKDNVNQTYPLTFGCPMAVDRLVGVDISNQVLVGGILAEVASTIRGRCNMLAFEQVIGGLAIPRVLSTEMARRVLPTATGNHEFGAVSDGYFLRLFDNELIKNIFYWNSLPFRGEGLVGYRTDVGVRRVLNHVFGTKYPELAREIHLRTYSFWNEMIKSGAERSDRWPSLKYWAREALYHLGQTYADTKKRNIQAIRFVSSVMCLIPPAPPNLADLMRQDFELSGEFGLYGDITIKKIKQMLEPEAVGWVCRSRISK